MTVGRVKADCEPTEQKCEGRQEAAHLRVVPRRKAGESAYRFSRCEAQTCDIGSSCGSNPTEDSYWLHVLYKLSAYSSKSWVSTLE